jgi:hypothetical protein
MSDIDSTKKEIIKKYPFMSYVTYGGNGYLGIIQNSNPVITGIYHFDSLITDEEKQLFLTLGDEWWWQSNRQIPINIFIKADWKAFSHTLKTFNSKDVEIEFGPCVNLREIALKRTKKKSITLVRKIE